ncbi:MAG TPA: DoxX family protein [Fimbriimonadaceae bacterium]|nr:DoxX family protein [Fimbriimonadaceae bacterium]
MKIEQTNDLPESDSRHHAMNLSKALKDLADHARDDTTKVQDAGGRVLLDTTAETLSGLAVAHEHFASGGESSAIERLRLTRLMRVLATRAPAATILVRFLAGAVFLSEGIQKLIFPMELGFGRFALLDLPSPALMATFVGWTEIVCGTLLLVGFLTRLAAIPLTADIIVAIQKTKVPLLAQEGFWKTVHEARTDWCMLTACLFLLIVGAGSISIDHRTTRVT